MRAFADDTADEADLHFSLGAEAYQRADYRGALEHFLASNRLAPNKNVLFNIARSYEKLRQFPEAYRYYSQALEGENDPSAQGKIKSALEQIRTEVAVLSIVTDPPGATLYLDRRNLGPRGESPRALGVPAGRYKVIAELPGYEPAEVDVPEARLGSETPVALKLKPILGSVEVVGPPDAIAHINGAKQGCRLPCTQSLAPGKHMLVVDRPGYHSAELYVDVLAHATVKVTPNFEPLTGRVVVSTDEPSALIEADGKPMGFSPAIFTLPVGEHKLRVSLRGFRSIERRVRIERDRETRLELALTQSEEVVAASRVLESVENAPSSVTIIPRAELRALAYPTIAEALRGTRGIYLWDDRSYITVGVRGLGRLGGYGNRLLVLYDGQPTNDNWVGSSYVGYDALTDLGDVERVEIVRGPGSVLYGTNAFSGVINVVSETDREPGASIGVSTNQNGVARARVRGDAKLGKHGGIWTSISAARGEGRNFYFPEYVDPAASGLSGESRSTDGFESATMRGRVFWKWLSAQWSLHSYEKQLPTGEYETILGDSRTRQTDTRAFVELRAEPKLTETITWLTRVHANHYRFHGVYPREVDAGGVEIDTFRGSWLGIEERLQLTPTEHLRLTFGGEGQFHYEVEQRARDDEGYFLDDSGDAARPYQVGAAYALADAELSPAARLSVGARFDAYSTFGSSLNPRAAAIFRPYDAGNLKIMAGKAFRAPSIYELHYNDAGFTQVESPDLDPESIYSLEVEHSHRFSSTVTGIIATYANYVTNIIVSEGSGDEQDPFHYENAQTPLLSLGAEVSLRRDWRQGFMVATTYAISRPQFLASESLEDLLSVKTDESKRKVSNAPLHQASLKGAVPILSRALTLASRLTIESGRYDRNESEGDPEQTKSDAHAVWDIVLSGTEPRWGVSYAFGVYNAFDWQYALPASGEFRQVYIPQDGRTFLASLDAEF